jgi:hypothetical protein
MLSLEVAVAVATEVVAVEMALLGKKLKKKVEEADWSER